MPQKFLVSLSLILSAVIIVCVVVAINVRDPRSRLLVTEACPKIRWLTYPVWVGVLPEARHLTERLRAAAKSWNEAVGEEVILVDNVDVWLLDILSADYTGMVLVTTTSKRSEVNPSRLAVTRLDVNDATCRVRRGLITVYDHVEITRLTTVLTHELGHVLTLSDEEVNSFSVMFHEIGPFATSILPQDINAVRRSMQ